MDAHSARERRWGLLALVALASVLGGGLFSRAAQGAGDSGTPPDEDFSVHVTRIENPETRFFRTNISAGAATDGSPDMFFYKIRDNKNGRILYYMYYKGNMLAPLYTTGD